MKATGKSVSSLRQDRHWHRFATASAPLPALRSRIGGGLPQRCFLPEKPPEEADAAHIPGPLMDRLSGLPATRSPRPAGRQVGRSAGRQVGRSAGRQVGRSAGRQVGRSAATSFTALDNPQPHSPHKCQPRAKGASFPRTRPRRQPPNRPCPNRLPEDEQAIPLPARVSPLRPCTLWHPRRPEPSLSCRAARSGSIRRIPSPYAPPKQPPYP